MIRRPPGSPRKRGWHIGRTDVADRVPVRIDGSARNWTKPSTYVIVHNYPQYSKQPIEPRSGTLKPLKRIWQRVEEPALMLAAAALSAALIVVVYMVFRMIG